MKITRKNLNRLIENFLLEADDSYDRAKAQHDIDYGDTRDRKLAFGPNPENRSTPIGDDEITRINLDHDPAGPTPSQAKHGQDYYQFYKDVDKDFDSVHSDKTQSFGSYIDDFDDEDTDEITLPGSDYGELGKTDPSISFDDETAIDPGDTIHSINPDDDFDLSLSDIEPEDYGTFEDDDFDDEDSSFLSKIKKFLLRK